MTSPRNDEEPVGAPAAEGDEQVEPGAIIRSPAPESTEDPSPEATRWPWEAAHDPATAPQAPKIEVGPTVRTEDLYRSHVDPAPVAADVTTPASDPSTAVVPPVTPVIPGAGIVGEAVPETISPMSAAVAVDPGVVNVEPRPERGLGAWGVFLLVTGITTVVGFVDMTINRQFTWFTGAAFVIAAVLGALMVRPRDLWTAVITPPLAFLISLIIAGQPSTLTGSGSLLLREAQLIGTGLAFNAPYIFGGTAAALIIVLIRRAMIGKRA